MEFMKKTNMKPTNKQIGFHPRNRANKTKMF